MSRNLCVEITSSSFEQGQEGANGFHDSNVVDAELALAVVLRLPFQFPADAESRRVNQSPQTCK